MSSEGPAPAHCGTGHQIAGPAGHVHSSYGEELGFNSDEEGYGRDAIDDVPPLPHDADQDSDIVEYTDDEFVVCEILNLWDIVDMAEEVAPDTDVTNGDASYREEEAGDTLPTDMSDTSDSEPDKPHNGGDVEKCTAAHDGKVLLRQEFPFNIDQMFTMIFTNSKFNLELLAARGTTDYVQDSDIVEYTDDEFVVCEILNLWDIVDMAEEVAPDTDVTNGDASYREEEAGDTLPTDMSDTSDSEPDKPHNGGDVEKCTAAHDGKVLLRQEFPFNIDQMFTMIFTNSKFNLELLAARGTTDYVQAPWQAAGGLKCRQISYTLGLTSGPIGPKEVQVTETQVMNKCSKPGVLYSIDSTSENAGIPYADYFSVQVHYCLQRVTDSSTELALFGSVKYKKTMWPMIKTFLEKNTISGLEEFIRLLESRLTAEADCAVPATRKSRRHRRVTSPRSLLGRVALPAGGLLRPLAARNAISQYFRTPLFYLADTRAQDAI
uniref:VASt domain-containing protein n=1 Tax=Heliothis virescens TaxID=7102 RepID=A0A2A4J2K9_HELVI